MTLPVEIGKAEVELLAADQARQDAVTALTRAEDALLLDAEKVNGKNEAQRSAQLRQLTAAERQVATLAERAFSEQKTRLSGLQTEFAALRAATRLFAAGS